MCQGLLRRLALLHMHLRSVIITTPTVAHLTWLATVTVITIAHKIRISILLRSDRLMLTQLLCYTVYAKHYFGYPP